MPRSGYRWPLAGTPHVTRPFQPPPQPWLPGHRGVDLAAMPGAAVLAASAGVVAFAGRVAGVGVVSVDHSDGLRTSYEPVTPLVRAGQRVTGGQRLGLLLPGHPGCPVAACLHWGLRRGSLYLDPLALLGYARVRLLPLVAPAIRAPVFFAVTGTSAARAVRRPGARTLPGGCRPARTGAAAAGPASG